jgi:hypothetical protein
MKAMSPTPEDQRRRQIQLLADADSMVETLHRLETKIDVGQIAVRGIKAAVNLALIAVLASVALWYGQARAQSDTASFTRCVATWADQSTKTQEARADANAKRVDFEKARGDAVSEAVKDLEHGVDPAKALRSIDRAQSIYDAAYAAYKIALAANPIPVSPKFSCEVQPFRITRTQYIIGGLIVGAVAIAFLIRIVRLTMLKIKEINSARRSRNSHTQHEEAREAAGRHNQTETSVSAPSGGGPGSPARGPEADGDHIPDGQER